MTICALVGNSSGPMEQLVSEPLDPNAHVHTSSPWMPSCSEDGGLGETDRKQLAETLLALGKVASADAKQSSPPTPNIGRQLRALATAAERTRTGTPLLTLALDSSGFDLAGSLFDDAWWFRHSRRTQSPVIARQRRRQGSRARTAKSALAWISRCRPSAISSARAKEDLPNSLEATRIVNS